jgi:hypothetical protein
MYRYRILKGPSPTVHISQVPTICPTLMGYGFMPKYPGIDPLSSTSIAYCLFYRSDFALNSLQDALLVQDEFNSFIALIATTPFLSKGNVTHGSVTCHPSSTLRSGNGNIVLTQFLLF